MSDPVGAGAAGHAGIKLIAAITLVAELHPSRVGNHRLPSRSPSGNGYHTFCQPAGDRVRPIDKEKPYHFPARRLAGLPRREAMGAAMFSRSDSLPVTYLCSTLAMRVWYGMPSCSALT